MRSFITNKLWNKIHQPHYSNRAPEAAAGADLMFVEVFLNRSYNGLYQLSEQVSRELLQLKNTMETFAVNYTKALNGAAQPLLTF